MKRLILILMIVLSQTVFSEWKLINISRFDRTDFTNIGNKIFAGTSVTGIYVSYDNGENWVQKINGLTCQKIKCLAVINNKIIAGTLGGGIFISTDYGDTWLPKNLGINYTDIYSLTVNGNDIFAGSIDGSVYLSTDEGEYWIEIYSGFGANVTTNVILVNKKTIYSGLSNGYLYFSKDYGENWDQIHYSTGICNAINSIAIKSDDSIFVGTSSCNVYFSADKGKSWKQKNNGFQNSVVKNLTIDGDVIFAGTSSGIYFTPDNGDNWYKMISNNFKNDYNIVSFAIINGNYYFGTFKSTDKGETWYDLVKDYQPFGQLYFVGNDLISFNHLGLLISKDFGKTYTLKNNGLPGKNISSLEFKSNTIYAATADSGLFRSIDYGENWNRLKLGNTKDFDVYCVKVNRDLVFASANDNGVYLSADNGDNWKKLAYNDEKEPVTRLVFKGNNIYQGSCGSVGVYMSSDTGKSWIKRNDGFSNYCIDELYCYSNYLIAIGYKSLFVSSDDGLLWTDKIKEVEPGNEYIYAYQMIAKDNIWILNTKNGVFLSTNYGDNWRNVSSGLYNLTVWSMAFYGNDVYLNNMDGLYKASLKDLLKTNFVEKESIEDNFKIYPNPATDFIEIFFDSIKYSSEHQNVKIYNMLGVCLMSVESQNLNNMKLDISNLAAGVYYLNAGSASKLFIKK